MNAIAILLCAGSSSRMRGSVDDKILANLGKYPVFVYSLQAFNTHKETNLFVVVYRNEEQKKQLEALCDKFAEKPVIWIEGGKERQDSVFNALNQVGGEQQIVFIHDCARPLVSAKQLRKLYRAALTDGAACLAHRVVDTIKQLDETATSPRNAVLHDLDRHRLWAMETPQVFKSDLIKSCYSTILNSGRTITDDTAAVSEEGHKVTLVENPLPNPKITYPQDLLLAEPLLKLLSQETDQ